MEGTTTTNGTKAKTSKGKKGKPATQKPATAKPVSATREQYRAECAAHVEALALLSEAEAAVLALIGTDDKKSVFHHIDVVRSCVFSAFPV